MITNVENFDFDETIIKCHDCESDAEFLLRYGKRYIPFCEQCIMDVALENLINSNAAFEISDLEDDDLREIREENFF